MPSEIQLVIEGNSEQSPVGPPAQIEADCVLAIGLCKKANLEPFCDELRTPSVVIPDDPIERVWTIQSDRVKSWIAEKFFANTDRMIADRDINQVLRVLEGRAWKTPRRVPKDEATWDVIERNPVALSLIIYANQYGDFDGLTRQLYKSVSHPIIQNKLMALANKFPVNTQVFSRRLKDVIPLLKTIGLEIALRHEEIGSHCTMKMVRPTFTQEPDAIPVIPSDTLGGKNPAQAGIGYRDDGTDAITRRRNNTEPNIPDLIGQIQAIREGSI